MARVKICGLNSAAAFDAAIDAGADWVGFVFFPPSPRFVTPAEAAALSARHPGGPPRIGLFVEPAVETVAAALAAVPLDALQIYGPYDQVTGLRFRFGIPVWHALGIGEAADLPFATTADVLLLESKPPPGADRPGGNARRFDWSLLRGWTAPTPWLLGGGLTPENVERALQQSGAPAVDVSSGVERAPGVKDPALIRAFVAAAKAAAPSGATLI